MVLNIIYLPLSEEMEKKCFMYFLAIKESDPIARFNDFRFFPKKVQNIDYNDNSI